MPLRFTSAMQTRTQDATPEPAKQTGCQRAPGKVQLRLDPIWRAPCLAMQPTRISRQNQTGLRGQSPYRARRHHCGCNFDSAMVTLPNICNHYATAMQSSATAVQSSATRGDAVPSDPTAGGNQSRTRNQHLPTHTTASRCQSKCGFFKVSFRNSQGTKHPSTGATQVQTRLQSSGHGNANANASAMQV